MLILAALEGGWCLSPVIVGQNGGLTLDQGCATHGSGAASGSLDFQYWLLTLAKAGRTIQLGLFI